jgi:hypothetical protein
LKHYWDKSHIISVQPLPQKWSFLGGGSTIFWILRWCYSGRSLIKMFLVRSWGQRTFLVEFSADRPKYWLQSHKWNFKSWTFLEIFFQIFRILFFILVQNMNMNRKIIKKLFSSWISLYTAPKKFHKSWSTFHVKMLVQRHYVFLNLEKNTKIFTFFHLPKNARKCQKTKNSKTKIFFWFFWNSHFFMENRQIGPNTGLKFREHVFTTLRDINNFRGKIA